MSFEVGDKVRLGESLDVVYEIVEFDEADPGVVKVIRAEGKDHPGVYAHWWRADMLRPAG
ncbi:hypothetical protein ACFYTF_29480 [Nocardia thailandica]|uniref:DUF2158 domain-containing protein n=1 Tax=Nocardia thailandica TaxID=257275 RepID=A0ABW6PX23_9NOCA